MNRLIKNYTTDISVDKTVNEITKLLSQNGAKGIATEYDDQGMIKDIFFRISLNNKELAFRLPAKPDKVYDALFANMFGKTERLVQGRKEKATMIAWRICKTWLEAQITLINLEQAKIEEVFLPYLVVGEKTLFETMEKNQFMLPSGGSEE